MYCAIDVHIILLNLAVRYGIAICIYASKKFWRILIWQLLRQSTNPPNLIPHQIFRLYGRYIEISHWILGTKFMCTGNYLKEPVFWNIQFLMGKKGHSIII